MVCEYPVAPSSWALHRSGSLTNEGALLEFHGVQEPRHIFRRQRLGEMVSLDEVAAHLHEQRLLLLGLDPFRYGLHTKGVRKVHDRAHYRRVLGILAQAPHEGLVYL